MKSDILLAATAAVNFELAALEHDVRVSDLTDEEVADLARAALTSAMPGWQPIETAPKDGTPIIGGFWSIRWADSHRKGDIVRCWWQPEFEAFISSCREMQMHNGYTFEDGSTRQLHSPVKEPVTHWMPLHVPTEAAVQS